MKLHHLRTAFLVICLLLVCSQGEGGPAPSEQESLLQGNLQALDFNTLALPGQTLAEEPLSPSTCSWGQFASDTGYHIVRDPQPSREIIWNGPWVYLADDNGNSFVIRVERFDFPIRAWASNIACAGIGGVRPAEISIDGSIGFFTMTVNGTWEPIYGNAGSEVSITSLDVNVQGLYGDFDAGSFDFLGDAITDIVMPAVQTLAVDAFVDAIRSQLQVLVPEPTTLSLLAMSLLFAGRRWR